MRHLIALDDDEEHSEGAGTSRWMVSYADFITLLFVLFLALYARMPKLTEEAAAPPMGRQAQTARDARPPSQHVETGHVETAQAPASPTPVAETQLPTPRPAMPAETQSPAPMPAPAGAPIPALVAQAAPPMPQASQAAPAPQAQSPATPAAPTPSRKIDYNAGVPQELTTAGTAGATPAAAPALPAPAASVPLSAAPSAAAQPSLAERLHQSFSEIAGSGSVSVGSHGNGIVLDIADSSLFASGTAQPSPQAQQIIARIVEAVSHGNGKIIVEGHTDNQPIKNSQFPSNWELSSARAAAIARALQERGISPERLTASGLADTRPRASNDNEAGRRQNRRVSIILQGG